MMSEGVYREIIDCLMKIPNPERKDVNISKLRVAGLHGLKSFPSNSELIRHLKPQERERLLHLLRRKVVRTISGVSIISVVTKPHLCPHGKCAYCPGGPPLEAPSAYVGREPAIMRGLHYRFDPFLQVESRIEQLKAIGHTVDKVEIIVMGGTFPATPLDYQERFIQRSLDAITNSKSLSLKQAMMNAEKSVMRNVGITVETRPDWARERHVNHLLSMGVTRVELGVQNIYDDIYELVNRGHKVQDVIEATRILKDSGMKVAYHLMPGLPGSSYGRDLRAFKRILRDPCFKPDMIKIYPCLVLRGTKLYDWWKRGEYKPYTTEEAAQLVVEFKKMMPSWIRIMRVQRDIPSHLIEAGVKRSNLRQMVLQRLKERGIRCRCIRCREVGHRLIKDDVEPNLDNIQIKVISEEASEGNDVFISAEDPLNDVLIGFLRLRIPSTKAHRSEIALEKTAIVRELHIYGPLVPVGKKMVIAWQHKGFGNTLLSEAERLSQEDYDVKKIVVTSALGTKRYYMRFGYDYEGPYVSKFLKE